MLNVDVSLKNTGERRFGRGHSIRRTRNTPPVVS